MQAARALPQAAGKVCARLPRLARRVPCPPRRVFASAASPGSTSAEYECFVIGNPERRVQGNCPICHGSLLYYGEKGLGVEVTRFVDESMQDPWIKKVCPGDIKMPMLHALREDRWLCGTQQIWGHIEAAHPDAPDLGRPALELPGGPVIGQVAPGFSNDRIYGLLRSALTDADESKAETSLQELEGLLRELDAWLAAREQEGQPFVGGTSPNATDCYLVPKLNHAMLALREIKGWGLPGLQLPGVERYLWSWKDRESWKHSHYEEGMALGFWQRKAEKAGRAGAGGSKAGAKPAL